VRSALAFAALALGIAAVAYAATRSTPVYPSKLPEGPERAIAERACLLCHGPQLINQQHKDEAGWEKTIAQMEKWGAPLKPEEHAALKAYFVRKLGPKAPSGAAKGPPAHP
jgi:hypothetical protein